MIQYWIQVPIENAKETINRFLAQYSYLLASYENFEVDYSYDTEAVAFNLQNGLTYDFNTIYFGEIRVPSAESTLELSVSDSVDQMPTLWAYNPIMSGKYPYIIFNEITTLPTFQCYFVGYKFHIAAPAPIFSYLLTEAGEIIEAENGDLILR